MRRGKLFPRKMCTSSWGTRLAWLRTRSAKLGVQFVEQTEQRGTGHAVQTARQATEGYENIIVLSGDVPLIRPETIRKVRDFHLEHRAAMTVLTAAPEELQGYGRVVRKSMNSEEVREIVEPKALTPELAKAKEINSGIYAFASKPLFAHIDSLGTKNAHGEFYLTDMAAILVAAGERVLALQAEDPTRCWRQYDCGNDGDRRQTPAHYRAPADGGRSDDFPPGDHGDRCRGDGGSGHGDRTLCPASG